MYRRQKCIFPYSAIVFLLLALITFSNCKDRHLPSSTPRMDADQRFWIRVLLLDDVNSCTLNTNSPFAVINSQTQTTEARLDHPSIPTNITITAGKITIAGQHFPGNQITILPDEPHIFTLNGDEYRGKLTIILNHDSNSFDAVNHIPLEPYLAGVVGAEMPDYWEPVALKAQAIAARTYCLYIKKRFGANRNWDISKTQAHQVYLGLAAESPQVWAAVNTTQGQVLVCKQADNSEDIFPAYYCSNCGGHTENSKYVFGDSFEPLTGVPCHYCKLIAKSSSFFWPAVQFYITDISAKLLQKYPQLKRLGEIKNIEPANKNDYDKFSRLTTFKLVGSNGKTDSLRAEDFRLSIDPSGRILKSAICQIVDMDNKWAFYCGRGYGHGVGMCQCGAEGMAREGKNARQILFYYYPGSKIVKVY